MQKYSFVTIMAFYLVLIALFLWIGAGITRWSKDIGQKIGEFSGGVLGIALGLVICVVLWENVGKNMVSWNGNGNAL